MDDFMMLFWFLLVLGDSLMFELLIAVRRNGICSRKMGLSSIFGDVACDSYVTESASALQHS
jgi:hypothetical protein